MKLRKNEILRFQFLVLCCFVASGSLAAAANYWIGADGADLADANNWEYYLSGVAQGTHALPTTEAGYFANKSGLSQYSMSLSTDLSLQQLFWFLNNMKTVINLGGHTLTLSGATNADIRMNNDGADSTMTNGTLTVADKVWLLGNNQTLTFGEGMTFNGLASLHSSVARLGNRIVAKDGAKVNGRLSVGGQNSGGEILVTGVGTVMDANSTGALSLGSASTSSSNTFRVENYAVVTNLSGGQAVDVGYTSQSRGNRLVVDSGASLYTKNWNVSGASDHTYLGKAGIHDGGNEIFVGDGAQLNTRVFWIYGDGNTLSISNGTFRAVKFEIYGTNTFHFAGNAPKLYQTGQNGCFFRAKCTYSFDVPAGGYASAPMDLFPGAAFTMTEDSILEVNVDAYREAGAGTVPLMTFRGGQDITFSDTLLSRWNGELEAKGCSVSYDATVRTLYLKVKKNSGLIISFR